MTIKKPVFFNVFRLIPLLLLSAGSHAASPIDDGGLSALTVPASYEGVVCADDAEHDHQCDDGLNIGAALEIAAATASEIAELDDALDTLARHLNGSSVLNTAQLYALRTEIQELSESGALSGNAALIEKAYDTIQSYEADNGALFSPAGTQSFSRSDSNTDGLELERTIHVVYLAVFDAIDSDLIVSNAALVERLAFSGTADFFPGPVTAPANSNAVYETQINASVPLDWGRPNLYSGVPARRPTGAYVAPGTIAEVTVPAALVNSGYQIRVGAHSWDLSARPSQKRLARASKLYPITSATTRVANPLGGNVYIEVPHLADAGMVSIELKNTVRSPYLSARSFDQISAAEWNNTERLQPAPWTDIETDKVMMSVPSKWVRDFDYADIAEILADYDTNADLVSDFMGKPRVRNKTLYFMQVDVIFRGPAFFPGYPMGNYPNFNSDTPGAPLQLGHAFDQTFLHEHGHASYVTKFQFETEAMVHMLYPYIATERFGLPLEESFSNSLHYAKSTERTMDDVFISWALRDEFLNNIDMGHENAAYKHRGHADYIEYVGLFGWDALTNFNRQLNVDFVERGIDFNRNSHPKNDRLLRFSREAGVDVRPLFHLWGHSPSDQAALQALLDAENLGPSAAIYDTMVAYKSTIPFTQDGYDAWYSKMAAVLFAGHRAEFWDPLGESYDTNRAQSAVDRIDALVELYFPNGRPPGEAVTVYSSVNFGGIAWEIPPGSYNTGSIIASPINNNSISSVRVEPGHEVTLCDNDSAGGNPGECITYTSSTAQLGTFNDKASSIRVLEVPQATQVEQFPQDRQLYPRDTVANTAPVTVSGAIGQEATGVVLNVYRENTLWNSQSHNKSVSSGFEFTVELPAELTNYKFELVVNSGNNNQTVVATAESVVAGDVIVMNGQSNAVAGIFSLEDTSTEDASNFIRTYGGWLQEGWSTNDDWHVVRAECRPNSQATACVGRMGLRVAADIQANAQVPVAVINHASGGRGIDYFAPNTNNLNDVTTNYGQLLTRLENGGLADNIRALLWYQGENDRTNNQAHFDQFPALFDQWQIQYPSVDQYYVFQIRHSCVPNDAEFGQGSQISNFQREFANARDNVTPVSTTGLDAHDGCHFGYVDGYQQMGDNVARMIRSEVYGENLDNADAADIVKSSIVNATTLELTFTEGNTLIADNDFEALFEIRDSENNQYNITAGEVRSGTSVRLTVDRAMQEDDGLSVTYLSLPGDQNWLTNEAGIGILSFLDFPVPGSQNPPTPDPTPEPSPGTGAAILYANENFGGASWEIAPGSYDIGSLIASPVGNDNISSVRVEPGHEVTLCQHGSGGGLCTTYTSSAAQLGTLNNQASHINVAELPLPVDPPTTPVPAPRPIPVPAPITSFGVDTDFDGVPDTVEVAENTDPSSASSFQDTDNDGVADFTDADSDGDGEWNLFESGAFPYYDRDDDAVPAYLDDNDYNSQVGNDDNQVEALFDADNNGVADFIEATTDSVDTDGDGVPDSVEAADSTVTTDASSFLDFDNDAIPDYLDEDDDNDGILDVIEGSSDADEDGLANQFDTDSDGDGVSDSEEGIADLDGDALPNFLDSTTTSVTPAQDNDNDGIADAVEGTDDADQDGTGNHLDADSDSDSLSDLVETNADVDGDGVPNFLDLDSDADGISDAIEGMDDNDNDGLGNAVDYDSDADSIPDSVELADDPDADGIPNYLDTDSDGDGVADELESARDSDGDGVADYLDKNGVVAIRTGTGSLDPLLMILWIGSFVMLWRRRRTR